MIDYQNGVPRPLDFGFQPSPSGGSLHAVQQEEVHNCYVVLWGYAPSLDSPDCVECPALVTGVRFTQLVFGYPNEEAFWKDSRGELGHGFFEIEGSGWSDSVDDYNARSFGRAWFRGERPRHFFIGSKDASCQVLARDLTVEPFPGKRFAEITGLIGQRIHDYFHGTAP
jgi:hypothetical protein